MGIEVDITGNFGLVEIPGEALVRQRECAQNPPSCGLIAAGQLSSSSSANIGKTVRSQPGWFGESGFACRGPRFGDLFLGVAE